MLLSFRGLLSAHCSPERLPSHRYVDPSGDLTLHAFDVVKPIAEIALEVSQLQNFTGRTEPSVIT